MRRRGQFPKYTDSDIDKDMRLTRTDYIKILRHYRRGLFPRKPQYSAPIAFSPRSYVAVSRLR